MKTLLSILLLAMAATENLFAQTTTLTIPSSTTQNVTVPAGQVLEILMLSREDYGDLTVDGNTFSLRKNFIMAGPKTVTVNAGSLKLTLTCKLTADSQNATANVASQAVVIPSNGTANADIIFESSPDLVTWTAAVAGSYAPTTANRFFRVRLVTH